MSLEGATGRGVEGHLAAKVAGGRYKRQRKLSEGRRKKEEKIRTVDGRGRK